ncbi:TetR/AcrR family transcriptional regulator [Lysinibacillus fusiformis]|uniref:TetR/AcrR family transcriptional regulator n=1 Tax=Lysinibacillus fusiformis TaxID=28031 RepID=UPI0035C10879|nr:helix-turn-helix domain-containing protein [Lysinibacillus fusiformis]
MARGRKFNSNGERSKQLLLEKAIELFSDKGYHHTKISDIVKAANVTQPTFYLYFKSKDALYNDLNVQFQSGFFEVMNSKSSDSVANGLEAFISILEQKLSNLFFYIIENPKLSKIGFIESKQAFLVKSQLTQQLIHLIYLYDCDKDLQRYCVDIKILIDSLVGSMERLILTNLLEQKRLPAELANDIVQLYFWKTKEMIQKSSHQS